jgi:hypothetical protein
MGPQVDAFGDLERLRRRVNGRLHQGPERNCGEHINVTIQIPGANGDEQITRTSLECVKVARRTRIAKIERSNLSTDFVRQDGRRQALIGRLRESDLCHGKQGCQGHQGQNQISQSEGHHQKQIRAGIFSSQSLIAER